MKSGSLFLAVLLFLTGSGLNEAASSQAGPDEMQAREDPETGQLLIFEGAQPVLQYNYRRVEPGSLLEEVSESNLKYARPRSDYIHPLYGLSGEELTKDWSIDHPHHRGIYWAWPEVTFANDMGDLHALQKVFARPTGNYFLHSETDYAQIEAENLWLWEDELPLVREWSVIRAHRETESGRFIDLEFHFEALVNGVSLARRGTDKYGGLNVRLASVADQKIELRLTGVEDEVPAEWAQLSGRFGDSADVTGISILQNSGNPDHPGEWIEYPELNWFQPTFPETGTRYQLETGSPLILRYRFWIHPGRKGEDEHRRVWEEYSRDSAIMRTRR